MLNLFILWAWIVSIWRTLTLIFLKVEPIFSRYHYKRCKFFINWWQYVKWFLPILTPLLHFLISLFPFIDHNSNFSFCRWFISFTMIISLQADSNRLLFNLILLNGLNFGKTFPAKWSINCWLLQFVEITRFRAHTPVVWCLIFVSWFCPAVHIKYIGINSIQYYPGIFIIYTDRI